MPNEDQEVWKTYPEFPFIEVSNLGEVRTKNRYVQSRGRGKRLIKGRVLKQFKSCGGYMKVNFRVNGKQINRYVHRMVAITFIPNPYDYPEVNHIDNNPTNNAVSNLNWCTHEWNIDYRKECGTSATELFGHPVFAVNLETSEVFKFESQHEAARQLGIDQRKVNDVIRGRIETTHGYWFTEDESEITEEKIREIKESMWSRPIIAVDLDTLIVLHFNSQKEAEYQLGISHQNISVAVRGQRTQTCGYYFCYADENAIEKVRSRFGDEVAKKVEELMSKA